MIPLALKDEQHCCSFFDRYPAAAFLNPEMTAYCPMIG
jgi:hypothetical protein